MAKILSVSRKSHHPIETLQYNREDVCFVLSCYRGSRGNSLEPRKPSQQKKASCLVFDCLNGTACSPFKNYFQGLNHNALNTRNNGKAAKLPKVKLDFARRSFYFLGASIFNSLPLSLRNINSRVLFRKALEDYYL